MNHLSASSLEMFLKCQRQWAFRYVEGLKIPPPVAIVQGSCVHTATEHNYAYKVETQEDLPIDEVLDVARDAFVTSSEEIEDWANKNPGEVLDETVGMTKVYQTNLAPTIQPVSVEREIILNHESWLVPLLGYIDVETEDRAIDIKTSGKKKTQDELDNSIQADIYLMKRSEEGLGESFDWHVAVKTKTPYTQVLNRQWIDHDLTVSTIASLQEGIQVAIQSGCFMPAARMPGVWWCNSESCGYWLLCEYARR